MELSGLLQRIEHTVLYGSTEQVQITQVGCHSEKVREGSIFVCIRGSRFDGHEYAVEAVQKGAAVIISEEAALPTERKAQLIALCRQKNPAVVWVETPCSRKALAFLSAAFFKDPAERMTTIGITGTKGKTTTAYLIREVLKQAGWKVGLIGTIETIIGEEHIPAGNTTPESCILQEYLYRMAQAGVQAVVMEVSSQGLKLGRTEGFLFDYGIFTNLGEDHIGPGEHRDLQEYISCKSLLFQKCKTGILNLDDPFFQRILQDHSCKVITYGTSVQADYRALDLKLLKKDRKLAVEFLLRQQGTQEGKDRFFDTAAPGNFNVYNSLAAIALCRDLGISEETLKSALEKVQIRGRMERIETGEDYILLIDYAHNAMSLKSLLETLKEYHPNRLICLFGCGGNRSALRRLQMGKVSGELADLTIITSDNPRYEEPQAIIEDILKGMTETTGRYVTICDRREAIAYALDQAEQGDILVLAGKGHENYQEIRGVRYPMDERQIVREWMEGKVHERKICQHRDRNIP